MKQFKISNVPKSSRFIFYRYILFIFILGFVFTSRGKTVLLTKISLVNLETTFIFKMINGWRIKEYTFLFISWLNVFNNSVILVFYFRNSSSFVFAQNELPVYIFKKNISIFKLSAEKSWMPPPPPMLRLFYHNIASIHLYGGGFFLGGVSIF